MFSLKRIVDIAPILKQPQVVTKSQIWAELKAEAASGKLSPIPKFPRIMDNPQIKEILKDFENLPFTNITSPWVLKESLFNKEERIKAVNSLPKEKQEKLLNLAKQKKEKLEELSKEKIELIKKQLGITEIPTKEELEVKRQELMKELSIESILQRPEIKKIMDDMAKLNRLARNALPMIRKEIEDLKKLEENLANINIDEEFDKNPGFRAQFKEALRKDKWNPQEGDD